MTIRKLSLLVVLPLIVLLFTPLLSAQQQSTTQQQTTMEDLKKQIQALTQAVSAMQKDLQDIKTMLQSRVAPAGPPENVALDLANYPVRGSAAAKLTLVEFSDYQ